MDMATFQPTLYKDINKRMKAAFAMLRQHVVRPAKGFLHHDYLATYGMRSSRTTTTP